MDKKVLSQVEIYTGEIGPKKIIEIDRPKLRIDILESFCLKNFIKNREEDYEIKSSYPLEHVRIYLKDQFAFHYKDTLILKNEFGSVYLPMQQSLNRNHIDPFSLETSPDLTCVYAVEMKERSSTLVIEYDDNRYKGKQWRYPMRNNRFWMFPSGCRYYFTANKSDDLNVFLTFNFNILTR
jgi:hypothetical protein